VRQRHGVLENPKEGDFNSVKPLSRVIGRSQREFREKGSTKRRKTIKVGGWGGRGGEGILMNGRGIRKQSGNAE